MGWNKEEIYLDNISYCPGGSPVLENLDLSFKPACVTVILGSSGSGKSSALKAAAGLLPLDKGEVKYGNQSIHKMNHKDFVLMQRHTGFMFQDGALWANKSIEENLTLPLVVADFNINRTLVKEKVLQALDIFSMKKVLQYRPAALSAGERKIISFLRAVITEPDILFLDEPSADVDRKNARILIKKLHEYKTMGKTILLVSHDINLARSLGDYIVFFHEGRNVLHDKVDACMKSNNIPWRNFLADQNSDELTESF